MAAQYPCDSVDNHFLKLDRESLYALARREKWFHNMRIGDYETGSWVYGDNLPPNYHLYPTFQFLNEFNLTGTTCIDIGTFDGMGAFCMAGRGAERVDATCQYNLDRFRIARALLGYSCVSYFPHTDLALIRRDFKSAQYDLILMTAMLHHLLSPIEGLLEARRLLKRGGYLIVEALVREGGPADFKLNTALADPVYGCPTLWIATSESIKQILRLASFNPLAEIQLTGTKAARESNYDRVTILAQASSRDKLVDRKEKLIEFHSQIHVIGGYDYRNFEDLLNEESRLCIRKESRFLNSAHKINIWLPPPDELLQPIFKHKSPL